MINKDRIFFIIRFPFIDLNSSLSITIEHIKVPFKPVFFSASQNVQLHEITNYVVFIPFSFVTKSNCFEHLTTILRSLNIQDRVSKNLKFDKQVYFRANKILTLVSCSKLLAFFLCYEISLLRRWIYSNLCFFSLGLRSYFPFFRSSNIVHRDIDFSVELLKKLFRNKWCEVLPTYHFRHCNPDTSNVTTLESQVLKKRKFWKLLLLKQINFKKMANDVHTIFWTIIFQTIFPKIGLDFLSSWGPVPWRPPLWERSVGSFPGQRLLSEREGTMLHTNLLRHFKKIVTGDMFGSLSRILEDKLAFKTCKICWCQKY